MKGWILGVAMGLAVCGCGGGDKAAPVPRTAEDAERQLGKVFGEHPDAAARERVSSFSDAVKNDQFDRAFQELLQLGRYPAESVDQVVAVENADRLLQRRVLEAMERGDSNAVRVWELMKGTRRN